MSKTMKAVGYRKSLPITEPEALIDFEQAVPQPNGRDILVQVKAVSVNPVDTKVRRKVLPDHGQTKVLGWDACGVVAATGPEAVLFKEGDEVWYAGSLDRPGTNSEFHLVDERIVGRKPRSLADAEAAALPLTSITAWELLFDRFVVRPGKQVSEESILIVGAAGGVGSILIQLVRRLTSLTVIATASRDETANWVRSLGAHEVIDHHKPLSEELQRIGIPQVTHVAGLTQSDRHFDQIVESLAPQGKFGLIDDPGPLDISLLKHKSLSLHWELMFTRHLFQTPDLVMQHRLLNEVSDLVDDGVLKTTLHDHFGLVNAGNLKRAHTLIESGKAIGKIVLENF